MLESEIPFITETAPGCRLLTTRMGEKTLRLTLFTGPLGNILLDTGCASHIESFILPCLGRLGLKPADIGLVITSHCDTDHQGGNHAFKRLSPGTRFACGRLDRPLVENPARLWSERYDAMRREFGHAYDEDVREWVMRETGEPLAMDFTYDGGEILEVSPGRKLEIVHLPGHSAGHLGILDHESRILFGADALHGRGCPSHSGPGSVLCPTYEVIPDYRATIRRVRDLRLRGYVGCHWPIARTAAEVSEFCDLSERFADDCEAALLAELARAPAAGLSLTDLCGKVGTCVGDWPEAGSIHFGYAILGHLRDLDRRGLVRFARTSPDEPVRFFAS